MAKRQDGVNVTALARELGWSRNRVYRTIENGTLPAGTVSAELSMEQSERSAERSNAEIKSLPQSVLTAEAHLRQKRTPTDIRGGSLRGCRNTEQ
jgi:transposase-like protein